MYEEENFYFAEELMNISPRIISTSYGDIYSITAGMPGQPLILAVHGSGPKNSADFYAYLLQDYLIRVSYLEKFYVVSIDCPGYGRSGGSKEAVKTFPLQLFKEILGALNYKNYFAMIGMSQGGAAIFNAVFEDPNITDFMVMDRPVCGNIQRFRKFQVPTLLIYDIEDDGHPIWQGKLLYKQLKNTELYTYRSSQHPYWVQDNIWQRMLQFFAKQQKYERKAHINIEGQRKNKSYSKPKDKSSKKSTKKKNMSVDKIEQIKKKEKEEVKLMEIEEIEKSELMSLASRHLSSEREELEEKPEIRKKESVHYSNQFSEFMIIKALKKKEEAPPKIQSPPPKVQSALKVQIPLKNAQKPKQQLKQKQQQSKLKQQQKPLAQAKPITDEKKAETKAQLTKQQLQEQHKCAICYQILYRPITTNCNHQFCNKCMMESLLVNDKCPLCRAVIKKKTEDKQLHAKLIAEMSQKEIVKRESDFAKIETMMKSIVYIEIGNTSRELQTKQSMFTKTKKKYVWQLFVKQPRNFLIEEVSFNINMGDPSSKPVKVRNAPFVFESRGTFSFACEIIIKPKNKEYGDLTAVYRIDVEPGYHSKKLALKKKCYQK